MILSSLLKSVRRAALCSCLALSLGALANTAYAADPLPKFSDPDVNAFVKKYDDLVNVMTKDIKANDEAKLTEDNKKMDVLLGEVEGVAGKVKPEEGEAWKKFLTGEVERLSSAAQ